MTAETLQALQESIEHWERLANGTRKEGETIYGEDCALCALFYTGEEDCVGCPVAEQTGKPECHGTPWLQAMDALRKGYGSDEFKAAARVQLEFLKSLLPAEAAPSSPQDESTAQ